MRVLSGAQLTGGFPYIGFYLGELWFRVQGLGFRVQDSVFKVQGLGELGAYEGHVRLVWENHAPGSPQEQKAS